MPPLQKDTVNNYQWKKSVLAQITEVLGYEKQESMFLGNI